MYRCSDHNMFRGWARSRPGDLSWGRAQEETLASMRGPSGIESPVPEGLTYEALHRARRRARARGAST